MALVTRVSWADRASGDIGCLHGVGPISDAIMEGARIAGEVQDGNAYSHCFVVGNGAILEAIYPKISLSPWTVYDKDTTAVFRLDVGLDLKQQSLLEIIHEYVGRGYDLTGVALGMAGLEIMRALHIPFENNLFAAKHRAWCSELAMRFVEKLLPVITSDPRSLDPQQVYNLLRGLE